MALPIGADVGGTFTDVVVERDGGYFSTNVLTTHHAPEVGILNGIQALAAEHAVDLTQVEQVIHGTTLATAAARPAPVLLAGALLAVLFLTWLALIVQYFAAGAHVEGADRVGFPWA